MLQAQHPLAQGLVHGAGACLPNLNNYQAQPKAGHRS